MKIIIYRRYFDNCTLGTAGIDHDGVMLFSFKTLELKWADNKRGVSCIPEGVYKITKENHKKYGLIFRIHDVKGRSGVLIHSGNYTYNSRGCILVGKNHVDMNNDNVIDVSDSKKTLKKITEILPDQAEIEIKHFD
jgi:hypothetical protein